MSTISAGTTTTTAFKVTSDTTGSLLLKTGASGATAIDIDAAQVVSIGNIAVTGGTINNTIIGGTTAVAGSFTTLTAASTVTLNGGTANGVAYLNGSKNLTTGSALTFDGTNLGIGTSNPAAYGTVAVNGASAGVHVNATTGAASFKLYEGAGTGRGAVTSLNGSNGLAFLQGTTEGMRLTSTGLGIGTASPVYKLDVQGGRTLATANSETYSIGVRNRASLAPNGNYWIGATNAVSPDMVFSNNAGTENLRLTDGGNLGIGTASPAVKLEVSGSVTTTADVSGLLTLGRFSAGYPWSLIRPSSGSSGFEFRSFAGTAWLNIDTSGNLGIGTASPAAKLHVVNSTPNSGKQTLFLDSNYGNAGDSVASIRATVNNNAGGTYIWGLTSESVLAHNMEFISGSNYVARSTTASYLSQAGGVFSFYSNQSLTAGNAFTPTERMRLDTSGNLGIGATSLTHRLDVRQDSSSTTVMAGVRVNNINFTTNTQTGVGFYAADNYNAKIYTLRSGSSAGNLVLAINNGGGVAEANVVERARIDSSGNLGIGTDANALTNVLTVYRTGSTQAAMAAGNSNTGLNGTLFGVDTTGNGIIRQTQALPLIFSTSNTERARIDSNGRVIINGTTQLYTSTLTLYRTGNSYNLTSTVTSTANEGHVVFENGNGAVGTIFTNGTATAYNTSSDYRLKNTIAPMTGALAKVALLKPCTYKWNADGSDGQGFIAHELAEVVPQCVTGEKDAVDAEGKPQYQGVDTSFLVATLTAAIQELTARVASLESK